MRYFNGFSLKNEEIFFKEYLIDSDYSVAGFSYGAQRAFEYVYNSSNRVDRLILLSPAFFQNQKKSFVKTQLRYFKTNSDSYTEHFVKNVAYPSDIDLRDYLDIGSYDDLESLLLYSWDRDKILELIDRGVEIEVFLGEKDKIVDTQESFEFFSGLTTTYLIKGVGHLLVSEI
ncbi:MAG: pimelyl-ACP methyl ester esterase BioV [Epsilonproteobacteria bacterium]|nr:pimelyl-ACP methyl ester esterase BioV [Campylobacterota bacterium]